MFTGIGGRRGGVGVRSAGGPGRRRGPGPGLGGLPRGSFQTFAVGFAAYAQQLQAVGDAGGAIEVEGLGEVLPLGGRGRLRGLAERVSAGNALAQPPVGNGCHQTSVEVLVAGVFLVGDGDLLDPLLGGFLSSQGGGQGVLAQSLGLGQRKRRRWAALQPAQWRMRPGAGTWSCLARLKSPAGELFGRDQRRGMSAASWAPLAAR